MSKYSLRRIYIAKQTSQLPAHATRRLHTSPPCQFAGSISLSEEGAAENSIGDSNSQAAESKLSDLRFLTRRLRPDVDQVWGTYQHLQHQLHYDKLPLEVHQEVLRKCTLPAVEHRAAAARRLTPPSRKKEKHRHEPRMKMIIRNIRVAGFTPSIDDYHFVLEQFAAVGHYKGSMEVMKEVTKAGLPKTPQTYGLCLQALCHRLAMPYYENQRPRLINEVMDFCTKLQTEMEERRVPFTSVNVDLVVRLFKETSDVEGFQKLLKIAYGIDLSFPDRPPLELWGQTPTAEGESSSAVLSGSAEATPSTLPFSTAALTTTIDFFGKLGEVSKLVQAFEVLTTPLPTKSATTSPAYDEDEEDDFGVSNPQVAPWQTPYAVPNTTTYHFLIKWLARARRAHLARHYMLQAIRYEKDVDRQLRIACARKPQSELVPPHMAVNSQMLLAVFGLANRDKDLELMRWTLYKTGQVIKLKKSHIKYYERRWRWWRLAEKVANESVAKASDSEDADPAPSEEAPASTESASSAAFSSYFTPSSASEEVVDKTVHVPPTPYFDVDLTSSVPSSRTPPKPFKIGRHLHIIRNDMQQLEDLEERIADAVGRVTQRIKEKLGRRIWHARDIYLSHLGRRVVISREEWKKKARFRTTKTLPPRWEQVRAAKARRKAPQIAPGIVAAAVGIATPAIQTGAS
ncbi:hypothetical protein DAEQUDRAFT_592719 [Daedalea quercina L-15889]|uniref:Uncharacterized protein n=1 Tax=Daedalea quercina L-15889 TaxID=1314783 RepID=A0A165SX19_9APHY|nr:hypothetical protein DAEQUDRAFT_592719 [Daedalea quercina L-15889]